MGKSLCCILTEPSAICRIHMHTRKDSGADFYFVIFVCDKSIAVPKYLLLV